MGPQVVEDENVPREPPRVDFAQVFQNEASYVWSALKRLGVRREDLEDTAHEVFLAVYRHLGEYDPARPLRPWLFGIAYRVAWRYRRTLRNRREVAQEPPEQRDEAMPADEQLARSRDRALVAAALEELSLDRRAVFVMHDLDGHPMSEIAEALSIPGNTAYSRLRLARADFAAAVHRLRLRRGER